MTIQTITPEQKSLYNEIVTHPLQSYEWGEFREKSGVKIIRRGFFEENPSTGSGQKLVDGFQMTIHRIPKTNFTIGYLPKGKMPDSKLIEELQKIGKEEKCIFIQLEPNVIKQKNNDTTVIPAKAGIHGSPIVVGDDVFEKLKLKHAAHPLFTKYTFVLDLTKSEEELLRDMHPKARYNIKVANKHNVTVKEDNSETAFETYWDITEETTRRQKFYAHTKQYHKLQWQTFSHDTNLDELTSHLFTATYDGEVLTTLLFFIFHDTLYYPYGASSNEHRNVMHSNLAMWEGIRFGKKLGLKKFDMWGAMSAEPDPNDPWHGFHDFKRKFGPDHAEFIGSYDLVINPALYQGYKVADKLRWLYLRLKK
jgi:lipid II:glycine glycyltransferase (peptidoglycan interpeptide bridge formation enzyme)